MSSIRSLNNPWYHEFIKDTMDNMPVTASSDAKSIAKAILVAGAMIADAIDTKFSPDETGIGGISASLTEALERVNASLNKTQESLDG